MSETIQPMPEIDRKLEKVSDNEFKLTIDDKTNKVTSTAMHTRQNLRDIYQDNLKPSLDAVTQRIVEVRKKLEKLDVEDTPELRDLLDKLEKINQLKTKKGLTEQLEAMQKDHDLYAKQMREIEVAVPEVLRKQD